MPAARQIARRAWSVPGCTADRKQGLAPWYRQASGKATPITLGPYPELTLADARDKRTKLRRLLLDGGDPLQHREQVRRASRRATKYTFLKIATEWHGLKVRSWSPDYGKNVLRRLELDIFPAIGRLPIDEVTYRDLIDVFRIIEGCGAHEIAKSEKAVCAQIFSYAIQAGATVRNPLADMKNESPRLSWRPVSVGQAETT